MKNVFNAQKFIFIFPLFFIFCGCSLNSDLERVVFYGDSHIANWDVDFWFPYTANTNKGTPGRQIDHLSQTLKSDNKEKKIILIGINDILQSRLNIDTSLLALKVVKGFKIIVEKLDQKDMVLSIPYINQDYPDRNIFKTNLVIKNVNEEIRRLCFHHNIHFIDINNEITDANGLKKSYSQDGLHLNNRGYEIISKKVRPFLY